MEKVVDITIVILDEIRDLIPPLSVEEKKLLEESILREGCRDPLALWEREADFVLIDGHHRKNICDMGKIPFKTVIMKFENIEKVKLWVILNALAKRNLSKEVWTEFFQKVSYLQRGELLKTAKEEYEREHPETKQGTAGAIASNKTQGKDTTPDSGTASFVKETAVKTGFSESKIAEEIQIATDLIPEAKQKAQEDGWNKTTALEVARLEPEEQKEIITLQKPQKEQIVDQKAEEKEILRKAREIKKKNQEEKKSAKTKEILVSNVKEINLYDLKIINGDLFIDELPTADLIIADFPYNITEQGGSWKQGDEIVSFNGGEWDKGFDTLAAVDRLSTCLKLGGNMILFTDRAEISTLWNYAKKIGLTPKNIITWHKTNPPPNARRNFMSSTEFLIWITKPGAEYTWNGGGATHNFFESGICIGGERTDHPTQKPVSLISWLIKLFSNDGDTVLDPCAGSGTTGACKENRKYILIEKDPYYFSIIKERFAL